MSERRLILFSIGALGVSAVMAQLVLMREWLCAFFGNELMLGSFLAGWLLLTGLGARLGQTAARLRSPVRGLALAQALVAVLPLAQVFAIRALRDLVFLRGAEAGPIQAVLGCVVLLAPYCLVSGYMLPLACVISGSLPSGHRALGSPGRSGVAGVESPEGGAVGSSAAIGRVYVADALGSVAGGALFSFVLVPFLDHFALLCLPAFLNLLVAFLLASRFRLRGIAGLAALLAAVLPVLLVCVRPDFLSTALQFPQDQVLFLGSSPYGRLVVTARDGQLNFIENGVPVISTRQPEAAEEAVHYAMVQRPAARRVLLIGGAFSGAVAEILKYDPEEVVCVELDPRMIEAGRRFLPDAVADRRVRVVNTDGRMFLKQAVRAYDVILVNMPDPSTSQLNRFYTAGCLREARRALSADGVLSFAVGQYENFVSRDLARILATAFLTARSVFTNVLVVPGGRVFFIASDRPLSADIASLLEQRRIGTRLVNRHYLDAVSSSDRLADLRRAVEQPATLNTDSNPVLYFCHLRHWMGQFNTSLALAAGLMGLLLVLYLVRLSAPAFAVFASGFAASALEVALLLGFQALHGALYRQLGVVVTLFMAGLAAGAFLAGRRWRGSMPAASLDGKAAPRCDLLHPSPQVKLALIAFAIAALAVALPFLLRGLGGVGPGMVSVAVPLLAFLLALLVGMEFPLAGRIEFRNLAGTAARLYTADFAGACLGALLASAWFIPVLGLAHTCLLVAALNLLGGLALLSCKLRT